MRLNKDGEKNFKGVLGLVLSGLDAHYIDDLFPYGDVSSGRGVHESIQGPCA
jgi:hypothetical protein